MANEPSWDEIFNPRSAGDPAAPVPAATPTEWNPFEELGAATAPAPAPAPQAYPPTAQYPANPYPASPYPEAPAPSAPTQYGAPPAYQQPPTYEVPPTYPAPAPSPSTYPVDAPPTYQAPTAYQAPQGYEAPQAYEAPQQYQAPQQYEAPQQYQAPQQYEAPQAYEVAPPAPVYRAPEPELPTWPLPDATRDWPAEQTSAGAWSPEPAAPAVPNWKPEPPAAQAWQPEPTAAPTWQQEPTVLPPAPQAWQAEAAPVAWQPEVPAAPAWQPDATSEPGSVWSIAPEPAAPSAWNAEPVAPAPVPLIEPSLAPERAEDPFSAFADLFDPAPDPVVAAPVAASPATVAPAADPFDFTAAPAADPFDFAAAPAASAAVPATPDDPFAGLFGTAAPVGTGAATAAFAADDPARAGGGGGRDGSGRGSGGGRGGDGGGGPVPRKRSLKWLAITLPIVIVLGLGAGGAAYAWLNYEDQVRELFGWQLPNDYEGAGNGEDVVVTIQSGDLGSDVANTLHDAGVTMTFDAFYDLLLEQSENVNFIPGNYTLQKEMSAKSALDALLDPANKITSKLLITEGTVLTSTLEIIAETTGIPLADVQAAAADPTVYGIPAGEPSLEGWLFPATYELDGSESAQQILQMLVDEMISRLDGFGVAPEDRHEVLTKASIIQREAGSNQDDFFKIARVFQNRLDQGMNLQSDATVAYGTGNLQTVWTTDEERADAGNLYNTYANPGLPIGPIGAPGEVAIQAALAPADGPWLFFVPINLATGETVFSETADEHEAAVEQLRAWCDASDENASYCE